MVWWKDIGLEPEDMGVNFLSVTCCTTLGEIVNFSEPVSVRCTVGIILCVSLDFSKDSGPTQ